MARLYPVLTTVAILALIGLELSQWLTEPAVAPDRIQPSAPAPVQPAPAGTPAPAITPTSDSGEEDRAVARLDERLTDLEERLTDLEARQNDSSGSLFQLAGAIGDVNRQLAQLSRPAAPQEQSADSPAQVRELENQLAAEAPDSDAQQRLASLLAASPGGGYLGNVQFTSPRCGDSLCEVAVILERQADPDLDYRELLAGELALDGIQGVRVDPYDGNRLVVYLSRP